MVETDLPFGSRTAQRLLAIARNWEYRFATHVSLLPPNWRTLYELTKLKDAEFDALIDDGHGRSKYAGPISQCFAQLPPLVNSPNAGNE